MNWPRSKLLRLLAPAPGLLTPTARTQAFLGNEELGLGLRVVGNGIASEGEVLSFSGDGGLTPAIAGRRVSAVGIASDGQVALGSMLGFITAPVAPPGDEDYLIILKEVQPGKSVMTGGESAPFGQINTIEATPLQADDERTVTNPTGYAVDEETVFFDGASPLSVHRGLGIAAYELDVSGITGTVTEGWDSTSKSSELLYSSNGIGEILRVYLPILLPANFETWNNGETASIWLRFKGASGSVLSATLQAVMGSPVTANGDGTWKRMEIPFSYLAQTDFGIGGIYWLTVEVTCPNKDAVEIEAAVHYRYQPVRDYQ